MSNLYRSTIAALESEIATDEKEAEDARSTLQRILGRLEAKRKAQATLRALLSDSKVPIPQTRRSGLSWANRAEQVLKEHGKPMRLAAIVEKIDKKEYRSICQSINNNKQRFKKVSHGVWFIQNANGVDHAFHQS